METKTKCKFVSRDRVTVETPQGDRFTLGLSGVIPFEFQEQHCQIIAALFDKYYQGDPSVIMGPILRGMYQCRCWASVFWYGPDRGDERERIGARIKSLRMERRMDAQDVAQLADIDASNLSRIEKGKYSAGLDILCRIAAAMDCYVDIVPNNNRINMAGHIEPEEHKKWMITAKRSTFRLAECLEKYGEYHWQQSRYNVNVGDTIYVYVSEDREIKYKMTVEAINVRYDQWMVKEEEFWVDKDRINQDEGDTKYALLRLEAVSKSSKLTEENLVKHGFLRAPQGTKELEGDLLKFIERRF